MNGNYTAQNELFVRPVNGTETLSAELSASLTEKLKERKHWGRHSVENPMLVAVPAKWTPHVPEKGGKIYQVKGTEGILIVPVEVLLDRLQAQPNAAYSTAGKFIPCVYSPRQGIRLSFARPLFDNGIRLKDAEADTLKEAILKVRKLPKGKGYSTSEGTVYFLKELEK